MQALHPGRAMGEAPEKGGQKGIAVAAARLPAVKAPQHPRQEWLPIAFDSDMHSKGSGFGAWKSHRRRIDLELFVQILKSSCNSTPFSGKLILSYLPDFVKSK